MPGPGVPLGALRRHQELLRASGEWDRQAQKRATRLAGVPTVLELPAYGRGPASTTRRARGSAWTSAPRRFWSPDGTAARHHAVRLPARRVRPDPEPVDGARSLLAGVPLIGACTSQLMDLIAYAANLVPVRIDVDDGMTVAGFLKSVHDSVVFSIELGELPFEELVARLGIERSVSSHPLVQVCFGMHDQLVPDRITTDSVQVRVEEAHGGGSQFDLALLIGRAEPSLAGYAEYATGMWTAAEAEGFIADFREAAEELAAATAGALLQEVRCLPAARRAVLDTMNQTRRDFPASSLDELFRDAARRWPGAVAVRDAAAELSYAQLARAAAGQARLLREAGVTAGTGCSSGSSDRLPKPSRSSERPGRARRTSVST